jgi:hypothetical protein
MSGDIGSNPPGRRLRVLHIEDSELDHALAMTHPWSVRHPDEDHGRCEMLSAHGTTEENRTREEL